MKCGITPDLHFFRIKWRQRTRSLLHPTCSKTHYLFVNSFRYTVVLTISCSRDKYLIAYPEIDRPISEFRNGQRWRTSNLEIDIILRLDVTPVSPPREHPLQIVTGQSRSTR